MFRTFAAGGLLVRRQLWIWPLLAGLLLGIIGWFLRSSIESSMKADLAAELETILMADVKALELWARGQEVIAVSAATDPHVVPLCEKLIAIGAGGETSQLDLLKAPELAHLRTELDPVLKTHDYIGWVLVNQNLRIVGSARNEDLGIPVPKEDRLAVSTKALRGESIISAPRKSVVMLPDSKGELKVGVPTMFAWAPIRDSSRNVVGALGLRIRPELEFTEILGIARAGKTAETFAFNRDGLMVSQSRFNEQLRELGLLNADEDSILNMQLRDPGVNTVEGKRPTVRRQDQALTHPVATAIAGKDGIDVEGYRDYRGVPSVAAWIWIEKYDIGVVTEVDFAEAFAPIDLLRRAFWSMFALLGAAAVAIFGFTLVVARLNREARLAALKVMRLGQYTLEDKLGEGGMGVVYRGHHAMLHRPTAIKFLHAAATNPQSIARFEREVRLTSGLNHPNTIAIYDFGRTPEGIFYYAMEYLEGINLEELVRSFGPQPENRVICLLQQVCGSLAEAHHNGLIHRDIKPANIMLTERGGLYDFVKVLDFGLVKALDAQAESKLTSAGSFTGTPLYLSPEAVQTPDNVDIRTDLYAVGAVGYYLLTGSPVFEGHSVLDIVQKHAAAAPVPPSVRLGRPISPQLEAVLLQCLEKKREARPASAAELANTLGKVPVASPWTNEEARKWWKTKGLRPGDDSTTIDTKQEILMATLIHPTANVESGTP
jgi:hypothetical protein